MCVDHDSRPPIVPIAGAAVDSSSIELTATDGTRLAAFCAHASAPTGAGIIVLPDVRGLAPFYEELGLRFAEAGVDAVVIDYFGRTAGAERRGADFDSAHHVARTTWAGLRSDAIAGGEHLRGEHGIRSLFSIGFCFGGRVSFLLATVSELQLAGAIGFYGWPVGASRNDTPAPADVAGSMRAPILGIFGGDDQGIPPDTVATFRDALAAGGVEHDVISMAGAPHSFFDRKQETFATASAEAWAAVQAFIRKHTASA